MGQKNIEVFYLTLYGADMNGDNFLQNVYLCRHGETEWSLSGRHTSFTDLPLTLNGEKEIGELATRLKGKTFAAVFSSPLQRAKRSCEIAGYLSEAIIDDDLFEWRYGDYEGIKTEEIKRSLPDWSLFTHGCPNGESVEDVRIRADRMVEKVRAVPGDVALFSSGHFSRAFAARWLNFSLVAGRNFILNTGTLSILGYERAVPAIKLWNG